jgi:type IV pilus assembly protein PilA
MRTTRKSTKGFTLIELMIVVAIIGILAAIAIPNFLKFQAKAKQSEAKTNLAAVFTAQTSYFSEQGVYGGTFNEINWAPSGSPRYAYGLSTTNLQNVIGAAMDATAVAGCGNGSVQANTFSACARGDVDNDATFDEWLINDIKDLDNVTNDV